MGIRAERVCPVCGITFPGIGKKKCCGRSCANKKYNSESRPKINKTMKCKSCGEKFTFEGKQGRREHCSDVCRKQYNYRVKYKRICVHCGKEFMTKSFSRKTCSDECLHEIRRIEASSRHDKETVMLNKRKRRKRADDNKRKNISDKYVKLVLYKETGIKMSDICDSNIIELKRLQLRLHREISKCKGGM